MKDSEAIIYLYKEFINLKNNDSFHTLYERLFQDDPCTLPGTIIIGGSKAVY